MSDITAPLLKRLVLPASIDLAKGAVSFEVLVEAHDDTGGSGVESVTIWFDRQLSMQLFDFPFSSQILQLGPNSRDTFSDASPATAANSFTLRQSAASGTYQVDEVWVTDRAGNRTIYNSAQLQAMGLATSMAVSGGIVDNAGPTLSSLTLPASLDLSAGAASMKTAIAASDNPGGTGIDYALLRFDRPLMRDGGGSEFLVLGTAGADTFRDATPGTAIDETTILTTTNPGSYRLLDVVLRDQAGNQTTYTEAQLRALGVETVMEVKGSVADTTGPTLLDLYLPAVVPLRAQPHQIAAAVAVDGVGGTGVEWVFVAFDREIRFKEFTNAGIRIGAADSADSFKDGTSVYGTGAFTMTDATAPGTYHVTGVMVRDTAGNTTYYNAQQLQERGINTSMTVVAGEPTTTVAVAASGSQVRLSLASSQWAGQVGGSFELKLKYDPGQMQFASVKVNGVVSSSVTAKVFVVGDVARLTITGTTVLAQDAVVELAMDTVGGASTVRYAIDSFIVNDKPQLIGDGAAGTVMIGDAGANRFLDAHTASVIDGQGGLDQVILPGQVGDYRVRKTGDGFLVENFGDTRVLLKNVERIAIGKEWIALDADGAAGQVYRLYQAAFDRAPDKPGLNYWIGQADKGMSLHAIAREFSASAEFQRAVGVDPTAEAFVGALYDNILHRAPDPAGFQYWVETLKATGDKAAVLAAFSESAENVAQVVGVIEHGFGY